MKKLIIAYEKRGLSGIVDKPLYDLKWLFLLRNWSRSGANWLRLHMNWLLFYANWSRSAGLLLLIDNNYR